MSLTDKDRESIIRVSVDNVRAVGFEITIQSWGIKYSDKKHLWEIPKNTKCCPLACVVLNHQRKFKHIPEWKEYIAETVLETDSIWIDSFKRGFDGHSNKCCNDAAFELGKLLATDLFKQNQLSLKIK